ncbi:FAD-dependent oxidoreductase [Nocardioides sp. SYSU D00065]|uniref:FAD-dependent oxidoreductase n=1 Tax=Nocardioides sp. SYSU D00065 TaxID=2817378 RepID=UPI001B31C588|nr:FAD-dependent oxidoreductase [Nocardioides sp. SYSU D00065]
MRVKVLGAGIVGLSCADELRRRGHRVTVVDPQPGRGASHAAAGMLSPAGEVWHGESTVLDLGRRSMALWPSYAERLGVPLHTTGTLLVGRDHADLQDVHRQVDLLLGHGATVESLDAREVAALEPRLARVAGGALLPEDHSVDPRAVVAALLARVGTRPDDPEDRFDATVLATGARLPPPYASLVRGVRGEVVRAHSDDPPSRTVRGWVRGQHVYVVPRPDGEVVIGATQEERAGGPPTLGGVARLLWAARELVPGLDEAGLTDVTARDRPGTPDNLPLVGPTGQAGVVLAAGHFRHGVLLAPLTARLVADHLETGHTDPALDPRRLIAPQEENSWT